MIKAIRLRYCHRVRHRIKKKNFRNIYSHRIGVWEIIQTKKMATSENIPVKEVPVVTPEDEDKTSATSLEKPKTSGVDGTGCNGKTNQDEGNKKKRETHGKVWVTKKKQGQESLPN